MSSKSKPSAKSTRTRKPRKYAERRLFILNNPHAPRLCPELAVEIGLAESILLLQIEFWISISDNLRAGERWTWQSTRDIQHAFPFWGIGTINRTVHSLQSKHLIKVANFNSHKYDRTRWFALDLKGIEQLQSIRLAEEVFQNGTGQPRVFQNRAHSAQNGTRSIQFGTRSAQNRATIPETSAETSDPETTPSTTTPTAVKVERSSQPAAVVDERVFEFLDKLQIGEPTRSELAALNHVTPEYLQPWIEDLRDRREVGPGLRVLGIRAGELPPCALFKRRLGFADAYKEALGPEASNGNGREQH